MISLAFPDMFDSTKTKLHRDNKATLTNIRLLLHSCKDTLFGDPYFGSNIRKYIYDQNNVILRDIIIDDIYLCIKTFIPQVDINRKNIVLNSDGVEVTAVIHCINKIDNTPNMYDIKLTE